jgi:hypothetical protein
MSRILGAIEHVAIAALIGQKMLAPHKTAMDRVLTILSIAFCAAGVLLLIVAFERYLESIYRSDIAAAITAVVVLLIALGVFIAAKRSYFFQPSAPADAQKSIEKNIKDVLDLLHRDLNEPIRDNPKTAIIIAVLAGFMTERLRR